MAPAARAVRLSDDAEEFKVWLSEKVFQGRNGELRSSAEENSHPLRHLPLALFPELFDFAPDEVALEHAEMLQKKNAVEMIDFMAKGPGQKIFAANFKGFALRILSFDGDKLRAHDVTAESGNR